MSVALLDPLIAVTLLDPLIAVTLLDPLIAVTLLDPLIVHPSKWPAELVSLCAQRVFWQWHFVGLCYYKCLNFQN